MQEQSLQKYLHHHIPLSGAMGVIVKEASKSRVVLQASFEKNINHKQTVFGGSLHALTTLACWSLLHLRLNEMGCEGFQIVIAHSEIDYLQPVTDDFKAECEWIDGENWERFLKIFQKKGKARLELDAKVLEEEKLCVDFKGIFVALKG